MGLGRDHRSRTNLKVKVLDFVQFGGQGRLYYKLFDGRSHCKTRQAIPPTSLPRGPWPPVAADSNRERQPRRPGGWTPRGKLGVPGLIDFHAHIFEHRSSHRSRGSPRARTPARRGHRDSARRSGGRCRVGALGVVKRIAGSLNHRLENATNLTSKAESIRSCSFRRCSRFESKVELRQKRCAGPLLRGQQVNRQDGIHTAARKMECPLAVRWTKCSLNG